MSSTVHIAQVILNADGHSYFAEGIKACFNHEARKEFERLLNNKTNGKMPDLHYFVYKFRDKKFCSLKAFKASKNAVKYYLNAPDRIIVHFDKDFL